MKRLLTFFLTALLALGVGWATEVTDVLNRAFTGISGTNYTDWSDKTATSSAVYAGNSAGGNSSIQLRSTGNSGIITTTSGGKVKSIEITFNTNTANTRRLDVYGKNAAYTSTSDLYNSSNQGTRLGSATYSTSDNSTQNQTISISGDYKYIGIRSSSGALYLTEIKIVWEESATLVEEPAFSPVSGTTFLTTQEVTISAEEGATIYYNYDNGATWNQYSSPLTLNATTTVYAYAELNGVQSSVSSATYTKTGVATISEALAVLPYGTTFTYTGNAAVVTYHNGRFLWIRDGSGSGLIYRNSSDTGDFNNGDILDANWSAANSMYGVIPQFTSPSGVNSSANGGPVAPIDRTSGLTTANVNEYVLLTQVTPTLSSSYQYPYVTINGVNIFLQDYFNLGLSVTAGKTYDIEGIAYISQNSPYIYLTKVTGTEPEITAPASLTINDSGTGNTFTVIGTNLITNLSVTPTQPDVFTVGLASNLNQIQDWGFVSNDHTVNGTVTVNYTGRELAAENDIVLETQDDRKEVHVNYVADLYIVTDNGQNKVNGYSSDQWDFANGIQMTKKNGVYTAIFTAERANTFILFSRKLGDGVNWNTRYVFGPNSDGDWWLPVSGNGSDDIDLNDDDPIKIQTSGTFFITIDPTAGTFTITKEVVNEGDFELVTDYNDLAAGNEVIIVNSGEAGDAKALSTTQNNNNRGATDVTVNTFHKVTATNTTQIFTLEHDNDGWYFNTGSGYIYSPGSNNYLRTTTTRTEATASISISEDVATIQFVSTSRYLRYNSSSDLFSCYASGQSDVFIYQRSSQPKITVNPSSLELVIPAGDSSKEGTVAVTETNTTGTTSVAIEGTGANNFNATLNNGTLTVTYNGTATADSPDEATITLTNGTATATVTVTGYKLPVTLTITPADGYTFTTSTVTGSIECNVTDATIEYSFDGTNWQTYDANDGFTTPEVTSVGGTVTVYARVTINGETTTAQATYTRADASNLLYIKVTSIAQIKAGYKYILVHEEGPDALNDFTTSTYTGGTGVRVAWETTGSVINIDGTNAIEFTMSGDENAAQFYYGDGIYLGRNGTNGLGDNDQTEWVILKNTDNGGYYLAVGTNNDSYRLRYNHNMSGADKFRCYSNNTGQGVYLYVQGVAAPTIISLADLAEVGEVGEQYTISDELVGGKVTWDDNQGKFALFAKDNNLYADKRSPADGMESYLIEYVNSDTSFANEVAQEDYDQSNWIEILLPSAVTDKSVDQNTYQTTLDELKATYENKVLKAGTVTGDYIDALNPTIVVAENDVPEVESSSAYTPNIFCTANFLMENLDADGAKSYREGGGQYFMMDAKPQEFCKVVWAYYEGTGSYFIAPAQEGDQINGHNFHGSFKADMSLCEDYGVTATTPVAACFDPSGTEILYGFNAIVRKNPAYWTGGSNGAPRRVQPSDSPTEDTPAYIVYPLESQSSSDDTVTAVSEIMGKQGIESVRYYNLMGVESKTPFEGINIVVTRYSDGSTTANKVLR